MYHTWYRKHEERTAIIIDFNNAGFEISFQNKWDYSLYMSHEVLVIINNTWHNWNIINDFITGIAICLEFFGEVLFAIIASMKLELQNGGTFSQHASSRAYIMKHHQSAVKISIYYSWNIKNCPFCLILVYCRDNFGKWNTKHKVKLYILTPAPAFSNWKQKSNLHFFLICKYVVQCQHPLTTWHIDVYMY